MFLSGGHYNIIYPVDHSIHKYPTKGNSRVFPNEQVPQIEHLEEAKAPPPSCTPEIKTGNRHVWETLASAKKKRNLEPFMTEDGEVHLRSRA